MEGRVLFEENLLFDRTNHKRCVAQSGDAKLHLFYLADRGEEFFPPLYLVPPRFANKLEIDGIKEDPCTLAETPDMIDVLPCNMGPAQEDHVEILSLLFQVLLDRIHIGSIQHFNPKVLHKGAVRFER